MSESKTIHRLLAIDVSEGRFGGCEVWTECSKVGGKPFQDQISGNLTWDEWGYSTEVEHVTCKKSIAALKAAEEE